MDLLVLPEMALSGYVFSSPASILPYLEQPRIGPTSLLARDLATRLRCHVVAGYPEVRTRILPQAMNNSCPEKIHSAQDHQAADPASEA